MMTNEVLDLGKLASTCLERTMNWGFRSGPIKEAHVLNESFLSTLGKHRNEPYDDALEALKEKAATDSRDWKIFLGLFQGYVRIAHQISQRENAPNSLPLELSYDLTDVVFPSITARTFSHDGRRMAALNVKGDIVIYDTENGTPCSMLSGNYQRVSALAFSRDNEYLAAGDKDWNVLLFNLMTQQESHKEHLLAAEVCKFDFSSDNQLAVGMANGSLILLDLLRPSTQQYMEIHKKRYQTSQVNTLFDLLSQAGGLVPWPLFSPDCRYLARITIKQVDIFDLQFQRMIFSVKAPNCHAWNTAAFFEDGNRLAIGSDCDFAMGRGDDTTEAGLMHIFDTNWWKQASATVIPTYSHHDIIAVSPDGHRLAVVNSGSVELFSLTRRQETNTYDVKKSFVDYPFAEGWVDYLSFETENILKVGFFAYGRIQRMFLDDPLSSGV